MDKNSKNLKVKGSRSNRLLLFLFVITLAFIIFSFFVPLLPFNDDVKNFFADNLISFTGIVNIFTNPNNLQNLVKCALTIVVFYIIINFVSALLKKYSLKSKRQKTVMGMLTSFIKYIGYFVMFIVVLNVFGVDTSSILTGAAIFSAAIALGAQRLIADLLSGIFIVFENSVSVGDMVNIDGFRGCVEDLGIRTTKITGDSGETLIIGNSEFKKIINLSSHKTTTVCEVRINRIDDLDKIEKILVNELPEIISHSTNVIDDLTYLGVQSFSQDGSVVLKIAAKCDNSLTEQIQMYLNREIYKLFEKNKLFT
ncbi:MAG: mechanosensitive ion channel family protein [Christensenellaceae bacterium]|jgi:small conductance mechanosensitive channel|nr:mechanosensitive ion channel family protein [Christensenellaceae bacterium]